MPELPEVQTIVNDLNKKIIGRKIAGFWTDWRKMIKRPKADIFSSQIKGAKILEVKRRGKNILIYLTKQPTTHNQQLKTKNYILLIHQKMTGHLLMGRWKVERREKKEVVIPLTRGPLMEKVNDYIHLIFYLDNGFQLALSDLRKFAKVVFGPKEKIENLPELRELGPEALDPGLTLEGFKNIIYSCGRIRVAVGQWPKARCSRAVKQVLMDQNVIAGIGNIYSDEILWQAKIHPLTPTYKLKTYQLKNLYAAMRQILKKALKLRGASIADFRDTAGKPGFYAPKRLAYQREGEKCQRCGEEIKRVKIGGRSSCYCPKCQKRIER